MSISATPVRASDFDRFAVVAFAPPFIVAEVAAIQALSPPSLLPTIPAHVTVKGTFVEPTSLPEVISRITRVCSEAAPILVETDSVASSPAPTHASILALVRPNDALTALHTELWNQLSPLAQTIYASESRERYVPHLTLVHAISPDALEQAETVVARRSRHYSYMARTISLVGRHAGDTWKTIADFELGRSSDVPHAATE